MTTLISTATVLAIAYYWYTQKIQIHALRKKRVKKAKTKPIKSASEKPAYRCVVIKPGAEACEAAQQLRARAILMHEATALPLNACNTEKCNCRYLRYEDRRMRSRRNDLYTAGHFINDQNNKRDKQDRRQL